ncbi:MAG TPA: RdgB/HAM1 family non-canonical purine NTP pyrophosphatase [Acidimicrobiales bacterium]|nr:RdgB/HAM1 family non-canonical purine NTP pyrophosphatase [Acidimicrobiales bacterium]
MVLATANPDKAAEIAELLGEVPGLELEPRPAWVPEVEESGTTLVENARLKARALLEATGLPAVADDTGLEVAALDGAPGVYSSRYSGPHATYAQNVDKLLAELDRRGAAGAGEARTARFRSIAFAAFPDGREVWAEGVVDGLIADAPAGSGGFGYDPVFVPAEGDGRTFAEMTAAEKHAVSHRGRAFRALAVQLIGIMAETAGVGGPEHAGARPPRPPAGGRTRAQG